MGNTMDGLILGLGNSDEPPIVGVYIDSRLGSKAHPSQPGGLSEAGLRSQLNSTRSALHYTSPSQKLSEYFLHRCFFFVFFLKHPFSPYKPPRSCHISAKLILCVCVFT